MRITAYRLAIDVPSGWDGRISRHEHAHPTLHAANFALPPHDGSFGAAAVKSMKAHHAFVAIVEYDWGLAGRGLFSHHGVPLPLRASAASPRAMQRRVPGKAGIQHFFSQGDRAFCLYAVVGHEPSRRALVRHANDVLESLWIGARDS